MAHIERIIEDIEQSNPPFLTWTAALLGSVTVGLSGVVPIALLPLDTDLVHQQDTSTDNRKHLMVMTIKNKRTISEEHILRDKAQRMRDS